MVNSFISFIRGRGWGFPEYVHKLFIVWLVFICIITVIVASALITAICLIRRIIVNYNLSENGATNDKLIAVHLLFISLQYSALILLALAVVRNSNPYQTCD